MPGRRRTATGHERRRPGGRALSFLVAAPALFTIAVISVSLVAAARSDSGSRTPPAPQATRPPDGWYTVKPVTATPSAACVAVLQDNMALPTLSQHPCDPDDKLQRIWLQEVAVRTYLVKVRTSALTFWCTTLDSPEEGSRLHVRPCEKDSRRQRFVLDPVAAPERKDAGSQVFRLSPASTRAARMCVGIEPPGISAQSTRHAVHTACARAGVQGYTFTPTLAPRNG